MLAITDLPLAVLLLDPTGVVREANAAAEQVWGVGPGALAGRGATTLVDRPQAMLAARGAAGARIVAIRANGTPISLVAVSSPRADRWVVLQVREVNYEDAAREAGRYFDGLFENAPIGMAIYNTDGEFIRVNDAMCRILDRPAGELLGRRDQELTHHDDRAADLSAAWAILRGEIDTWQCEKRFVRADGTVVWVIANMVFLRDDSRRPLAWVGQFQDITAQRHRADHDPLTDLVNRRGFETALGEAAAGAANHGGSGALVVIDLDDFKAVNDRDGHAAGDALLVEVAAALRRSLREGDVAARLGGDEFAVLLRRVSPGQAREAAERLTRALPIGASAGVQPFGSGYPADPATLVRRADRAMYVHKRARLAATSARPS